jgi:hypothetical protein
MKDTIEYYDVILKEDFIIPVFDNVTPEELKAKYDRDVYGAMAAALEKLAVRPDWDRIPCFQMNDVVFEIDRSGYTEHLQNCVTYYTSTEEYETCAKLMRLDETLK